MADAIIVTSPQELEVSSDRSTQLVNGGHFTAEAEEVNTPKKQIVNTITVKEVKHFDKKLKEYIDESLRTVRQGQYVKVDTTTYPTLADFLASTGEQGTVYLYPIDTSDLTKGYYQYIWELSEWVDLGTTTLDLTGYIQGTYMSQDDYDDLDPKNPNLYYFIPEEE